MTPDDPMKIFEALAEQKKPLRLNNAYRGIPISYDAKVLTVSQGYMALNVHEYQAVCMTLEGKTYVECDALSDVLQARAVAVDVVTRQAILTEFTVVGHAIGKRTAVRVQPAEPADVEIYDGERRLPGKLADISALGVGVFTFATYIYGDLSFEKNASVFVDVRMPITGAIVRFQGKVTSVLHQKGTPLHRLGVKIYPNPTAEPVLNDYIARRQEEVLRELRAIYDIMVQEKEQRA